MKKLMIAAAIVCAAVIANATSVSWGIEYASDPWLDDDLGAGFTAYLLVNSASLGGSSVTYDYDTAVANLAKGDFSFVPGAAVSTSGFDYGEAMGEGGNLNNGSAEANNVVSAYAIILGKNDDGADVAYITSKNGTEITALGGSATIAFGDISAGTGTAGNWYVAPEPTSGLLLLIGVAGMALRRRRA